MSPDYVLHEMSWRNVVMYNTATPSYNRDDNDKVQSTSKGNVQKPNSFGGFISAMKQLQR